MERAYYNEAIAAIDIEDEQFREYLLWALPVVASYGAKNPAVRGATLNKKSIQALWIPVPSEVEQQSMVSRLTQLCVLIEQYATAYEQSRTVARDAFKLLVEKRRSRS